MPISGYFNIEQDKEIEKDGGFFCEACVVGRPIDDISLDPRYCLSCYDLLKQEDFFLPQSKQQKRVPRTLTRMPSEGLIKGDIKEKSSDPIPNHISLNMSTLKGVRIKKDIIQPPVPKGASVRRGPKLKVLPLELITRWASEGTGSKAIAARLKREHGIKVSYKTIQRIQHGQRVLVEG